MTLTVSYTGPATPAITISEAEVTEVIERHKFVLTNELGPLKTADQWFEEATQKRRLRDGSEKAYAWLLPFVPNEVAKLDQLKAVLERGPNSVAGVAKILRQIIREHRKVKQPCDGLLHALYKFCVLTDFAKSLAFEGMPVTVHVPTHYVDIRELQGIRIEYLSMGYQCVQALSKTDVKWLIEAFGEPAEHQSFDVLWPSIRRNAVSRYCWGELQSANEAAQSLGLPKKTIDEWLRELVKRYIGYHKEWLERNEAREARVTSIVADIEAALLATQVPFAVADLETTGLEAHAAEILELAVVLVEPDGSVTSEFSLFVKTQQSVPAEITRLTGITQADVDTQGQPLTDALEAFLTHIGKRPVFFHNAPFDQSFLSMACAKTKLQFKNAVHDTLPLARRAWPSLGTYKLGVLAEHVGAAAPKHRALGDAHATLAVLLAARNAAR
jgi:DNA polymerase-3 subunit epsilon